MSLPFVTWKDFYSVGCEELDQQHKVLLSIVNELYTAVGAEAERLAVQHVLDRLIEYGKVHFHREEELMYEHQYPGLAAHAALHNALTAKTMELREDWGNTPPSGVLKYLKEWWLNHICGKDKEYTPFMTGNQPATVDSLSV